MKKIASFEMNHDLLQPGMYVSRVDGDVVTYDIRMTIPNSGSYLDNPQLHTFEHLFATFARNTSFADSVVYVGPMGCRTGFYLLLRDSVSKENAIQMVQQTCDYIINFQGEIPGATKKECGNAADHDLDAAKTLGHHMSLVLKDWTPERMVYPS